MLETYLTVRLWLDYIIPIAIGVIVFVGLLSIMALVNISDWWEKYWKRKK